MSRTAPDAGLPTGSLRERLALLVSNRSGAVVRPNAFEAQRLVLAVTGQASPPQDVPTPDLPDRQRTANEDAAATTLRPIASSRRVSPLHAPLGRLTSQVAAASPAAR